MNNSYKRIIDFLGGSTFTPATLEELENIEHELGIRFPNSYREFQLEVGDFCHNSIEVFTVSSSNVCSDSILEMRKYISKYGDDAFTQAYNGEIPDIPENFIPFSYSGNNYYCFDIQNSTEGECPIVLFGDEPMVVADNFVDWFINEIE